MTFVFDIDGTIIYCNYTGAQYLLIRENTDLIKIINSRYEKGDTIILQTARHWNYLNATIEQLTFIGLKYHTLVMGKPVADLYIDDRGINPEEFIKLFKN